MSSSLSTHSFRPFNDFIGDTSNFAMPNFNDAKQFTNRVSNNLLYYQMNYFVLFFVFCFAVGAFHPYDFMMGLILTSAIVAGLVVATQKSRELQKLKLEKPHLHTLLIVASVLVALKFFGSLLVFMYSIFAPVAIAVLHATFRKRNTKNKLVNIKEEILGTKDSPMGFILEAIGVSQAPAQN